jgi:G3E family GTPase
MADKIPVTLLTGYLGAGKTTLLNRILAQQHGKRFAVIVNEFGAIGVDSELIVAARDDLTEMSNGCICCTMQGDFNRTLHGLMRGPERFDAILVETTGLTDPGPLAQTFLADHTIAMFSALDAIVTVADARWTPRHLSSAPEARTQIAFADVIILNKKDLVGPPELDDVEGQIRALNRHADIIRTQNCELPLDLLFDRHAFDLDLLRDIAPLAALHVGHQHREGDDHAHDDAIVSVALFYDGEVDRERLLGWFGALIESDGDRILRSKGILAFPGEPQRFVVQSVHNIIDGILQRAWAPGERRQSKLVLIGRGLDAEALGSAFRSFAIARD